MEAGPLGQGVGGLRPANPALQRLTFIGCEGQRWHRTSTWLGRPPYISENGRYHELLRYFRLIALRGGQEKTGGRPKTRAGKRRAAAARSSAHALFA